eukprot:TRINITY_DN126785_c0_g1_i1.p2 TRINITY_DN126785_c0_g1~~TRINITY_DN126785_c0_g1_i1.p2  ORF type:complete len:150 (+),score=7.88 TRINITY_DN126785_c0_g1_i1:230-679(+)
MKVCFPFDPKKEWKLHDQNYKDRQKRANNERFFVLELNKKVGQKRHECDISWCSQVQLHLFKEPFVEEKKKREKKVYEQKELISIPKPHSFFVNHKDSHKEKNRSYDNCLPTQKLKKLIPSNYRIRACPMRILIAKAYEVILDIPDDNW